MTHPNCIPAGGDLDAAAAFLKVSKTDLATTSNLLCGGLDDHAEPMWNVEAGVCRLLLDGAQVRLSQAFQRDGRGVLKVDFELLELPGHLQNRGLTKVALRNAAIVYDHLGVDYCAAFADFDIGGYAWARLGAFPVDPETCRRDLLQRLSEMEARGDCTTSQKTKLETLVTESPSDVLMYDVARTTDDGQLLGKILLIGYRWDAIWRVADAAQRGRVLGALT